MQAIWRVQDVPFTVYTSDISCFPKYMSEEMAFTSPNFIRASPVSDTGSGFLLAVGLKTDNGKKKKNRQAESQTVQRVLPAEPNSPLEGELWDFF